MFNLVLTLPLPTLNPFMSLEFIHWLAQILIQAGPLFAGRWLEQSRSNRDRFYSSVEFIASGKSYHQQLFQEENTHIWVKPKDIWLQQTAQMLTRRLLQELSDVRLRCLPMSLLWDTESKLILLQIPSRRINASDVLGGWICGVSRHIVRRK